MENTLNGAGWNRGDLDGGEAIHSPRDSSWAPCEPGTHLCHTSGNKTDCSLPALSSCPAGGDRQTAMRKMKWGPVLGSQRDQAGSAAATGGTQECWEAGLAGFAGGAPGLGGKRSRGGPRVVSPMVAAVY